MVFHYRSTPDESIQAMRAAAGTVTSRWTGLPALVVTILGIAAFAHLVSRDWIQVTVLAYIAVAVFPAVVRLEQRFRWRRAIKADPHSAEEQHVEVSDAGLRFWCEHSDSKLTWSGVRRVQETAHHYVFVCGPLGGCPIPKRVISDDDEPELRDLIRRCSPDHGTHLARELATQAVAT